MDHMTYRFLLVMILVIPFALQASTTGVDFGTGLWFSNEQPLADQPLRIYTSVQNNSKSDLTGTLVFTVNEKELTRRPVQVLAGGEIEAWADWTPKSGTSTVAVTMVNVKSDPIGASQEDIVIETKPTKELLIDIDTDGDGVGNQNDTDDDGDGVSDEIEIKNGTDPLVADTAKNQETEPSSSDNPPRSSNNDQPIGLEQYLTDSPARATLAGLTRGINDTKKRLDEYRETRNQNLETNESTENMSETVSSTESDSIYDENGFGTVTREQNEGESTSILTAVSNVLLAALSGLYTFTLFVLSVILGHPTAVQLGLLILILFLIFKLAKRLGGRPQ